MALRSCYEITCDKCDLTERLDEAWNLATAKREAREIGWVVGCENHTCPNCKHLLKLEKKDGK